VNQNLLKSIARIESNNNPSAINHNNNGTSDLGIMQINSSWIKPMGLDRHELLKNPCYNVMTGAKILK
jgi:soluble lytic murein transglycosylase-like protein